MNIFNRLFKKGATEFKENQLNKALYQFLGVSSPAWIDDDFQQYIEKGYAYHIDLYSIISRITEKAAFVFFDGVEVQELNGDTWETLPEHRSLDVLKNPSPNCTGIEYIEQEIGYYLICGNSYTYGIGPENGPNKGEFLELHTMPAQYTEIEFSGNYMDPVGGYQIEWSQNTKIEKDKVMHRKTFNPQYGYNTGSSLYGLSPLKAASRLITKSNDSYTANAKLLANSGAIGILSQDASADARQAVTQEQAELITKKYKQNYGGSENYGKILISSAALKWQQIGMNAADLNLIESMEYDLRKLCSLYNVPSVLFNDNATSTYNNMQEARKAFINDAILPNIARLIGELNRWFMAPFAKNEGKNLRLFFNKGNISELAPDYSKIAEATTKLWQLTPNEVRKMLGKSELELPEMDEIYIPGNLLPISAPQIDLNKNLTDYNDF